MPSVLSGSILQFGSFRLDCGRFQLSRDGHPLRVERKPMELLILLASRDGQVVTRQQIAERLWSSQVFVDTEHGINTAIRKLRYLLRDDPGDPHFIQPGITISDFDISPDGRQVVYTTPASDGRTQLWVSQLDRSSAPIKLNVSSARSPHYGAHGRILFQHAEGNSNYLEQIAPDGSHRSKVFPYPIIEFQGVSPGRRWVIASVPLMPPGNLPEIAVIPLQGGALRRICDGYCQPKWSPDGKFLFVTVVAPSHAGPGRTLAIPLGPAESFPNLPARGISPMTEPSVIPEAKLIARGRLVPGQDPEHYAWVNTIIHRNLYRLSLP